MSKQKLSPEEIARRQHQQYLIRKNIYDTEQTLQDFKYNTNNNQIQYSPDSQYHSEINDINFNSTQQDYNNGLAAAQGKFSELGNAIVGGALNIIPTFVDYGASILDVENYGGETDYKNPVSSTMQGITQSINEQFPIYKSSDAGTFSSESLNQTLQGVISSGVAFAALNYITAGGASSVLGASTAARLITTLGTSLLMTHAEGVGVARDVYDKGLNLQIDNALKNYTEKNPYATQAQVEAEYNRLKEDPSLKAKAMEGADISHNMNMGNFLLNLSGVTRILQPTMLSREAAKSFAMKNLLKEYALEGGQEAIEENINLVSEKAGLAHIQNKAFELGHIADAVFSKEGLESAIGGLMGSAVQQGATDTYRGLNGEFKRQNERYKEAEANKAQLQGFISEINKQKAELNAVTNQVPKQVGFDTFTKNLKEVASIQADIEKATIAGDNDLVDFHKNRLMSQLAVEAFKLGNGEDFEKVVDTLVGMSTNDIKETVGIENAEIVRPTLAEIKRVFKKSEEIYNNSVSKIPTNIIGDYVKNRVEANELNLLKTKVDTNLAKNNEAQQAFIALQVLQAQDSTKYDTKDAEINKYIETLSPEVQSILYEHINKTNGITELLNKNTQELIFLMSTGKSKSEQEEDLLEEEEAQIIKEQENAVKNAQRETDKAEVINQDKTPEEVKKTKAEVEANIAELESKLDSIADYLTNPDLDSEERTKLLNEQKEFVSELDSLHNQLDGINKVVASQEVKPQPKKEDSNLPKVLQRINYLENQLEIVKNEINNSSGLKKISKKKERNKILKELKELSNYKNKPIPEPKKLDTFTESNVAKKQIQEEEFLSLNDYFAKQRKKLIKKLKITSLEDLYKELTLAKDNLLLSNKAISSLKYENLKQGIQTISAEDYEEIMSVIENNKNIVDIIENEIVKRELENSNKEVIILNENTEEEKYSLKEKELEETFKNFEVISDETGKYFTIRGKEYRNSYSNPLLAINRDNNDNIVSIELTDSNNNKKTFSESKIVDEISYIILLSNYVNNQEVKISDSQEINEISEDLVEKLENVNDIDESILKHDLLEVEETIEFLTKKLTKEKNILKKGGLDTNSIKELIQESSDYMNLQELKEIKTIILNKLKDNSKNILDEKPVKITSKIKSKRTSRVNKTKNSQRQNNISGETEQTNIISEAVVTPEPAPQPVDEKLNKALTIDINGLSETSLNNLKKYLEKIENPTEEITNRLKEVNAKLNPATTSTSEELEQKEYENLSKIANMSVAELQSIIEINCE